MSSDRPSDGPSSSPEAGAASRGPDEAALARRNGEPLLEALEQRLPGARLHADAAASYAFATAVELGLDRANCELIREAARLHEAGRLYLTSAERSRPVTELPYEERARLAEAGHRLALGAGVPERACEWILHSAERADALGEVEDPVGEGVRLPSRIIAAACAYDVELAQVPATAPAGIQRAAALGRLRETARDELDDVIIDALARVVERAAAAARR